MVFVASSDGVRLQLIFKRRQTNEAMTTFFPSMLLVAITYATTYFKPFFFESALTVNLTVMLVITTLFISVMNKLASTSYIKWIEFWLIFAQLIPFTEVVLLTVLELYRDDMSREINHHGRHVQVSGGLKLQMIDKTSIIKILKTIGLLEQGNYSL